jgi:hypothetical protein
LPYKTKVKLLEVKTMKKLIITLFLTILGSITMFAQTSDYPNGIGKKFTGNTEKECYETTNSYTDFKRCVENRNLPTCPKGWEMTRDWETKPCRDDEDYRLPKTKYLIETYPIDGKEIKDNFKYRQLPNEQPESFEPSFIPFVND